MIRNIRHRGLKRLFEHDDRSKLRPDLVEKIILLLGRLDAAGSIDDMDVPGLGLHRLSGDFRGFWSVTVSRNWRIVFRFDQGDAFDVDFVDYH
ncbi:MAG: type II toxin-antitoxin system RelE/ParE family toxin [Pseudolabrys sp.]|nr:type II toxin-antitoxin system RelE/ParE family toxin [Pseudolabrys sp.]MDP2296096.1 type II toxin-antitoxin system RelE/ParE family toxin [Pseudolabrys sp.]